MMTKRVCPRVPVPCTNTHDGWFQWVQYECTSRMCGCVPLCFLSCATAVADVNLRNSFAAAAPDQALRVPWGGWQWRPDKQWPEWSVVLSAGLYTDPEYSSLRKVVMAKKYKAVQAAGSSLEVLSLRVEGRDDGDGERLIRIYSTKVVRGVPENVAGVPVKLAVHRAKALSAPPEHINAAVAAGSLLVIWGVAADVKYAAGQLPDVGFALTSVDIVYFVRARIGGPMLCQQQLIRVIGATGSVRQQVRLFHPQGSVPLCPPRLRVRPWCQGR